MKPNFSWSKKKVINFKAIEKFNNIQCKVWKIRPKTL